MRRFLAASVAVLSFTGTVSALAVRATGSIAGAGAANASARTVAPFALPNRERADAPLVADWSSHVIVMEYEAWFGPHAVTFPPKNLSPRPLLSSADMIPAGGGYDSEDPNVIRTHVRLLTAMGVDAVALDLTNNVSCIFDTGPDALNPALLDPCGQSSVVNNRSFQQSMQQIAANDANIYAAWSKLGTSLKIIPLLACQDNGCLTPYSDSGAVTGFGPDQCPALPGVPAGSLTGNPAVHGTTSFEKELAFFGTLMARQPQLSVTYESKPLVLVFAPPGIDDDPCEMQRLHDLIVARGLDRKFTFRMVGGYFDTDRTFWNEPAGFQPTAPVPLKIAFGSTWWSWVDRLNPPFGYYPSYNRTVGGRVENLTASIAVAGQNGWGTWPSPCPSPPRKIRH